MCHLYGDTQLKKNLHRLENEKGEYEFENGYNLIKCDQENRQ